MLRKAYFLSSRSSVFSLFSLPFRSLRSIPFLFFSFLSFRIRECGYIIYNPKQKKQRQRLQKRLSTRNRNRNYETYTKRKIYEKRLRNVITIAMTTPAPWKDIESILFKFKQHSSTIGNYPNIHKLLNSTYSNSFSDADLDDIFEDSTRAKIKPNAITIIRDKKLQTWNQLQLSPPIKP